MSNNLPTGGSQIEAARSRLYDALAPLNEAEREVIHYLTRALSMPGSLEVLVTMAERAANVARAEGYDRGWAERGEQS